jgi:hypothetical protein
MAAVLIQGEGIAASCCLRLLTDAGIDVSVEKSGRPKLPAIMLGEATQKLLRDVFRRADLCDNLPRIKRRVVAWGPGSAPLTLPHSAVVVSEHELWYRIRERLPQVCSSESADADWTIVASGSPDSSSVEHHFGTRMAAAAPAKLHDGHDAEACWIESLQDGWLFLLPTAREAQARQGAATSEGTGWLLSVGAAAESLLAVSSLIQKQIAELLPSRGAFASYPRAVFPLSGPRWLACGTSAISFDPLCGDGTGNAIREAILASAVIRAAIAGADAQRLEELYQARLLAGFQRHLALCFDFYKKGHGGSWWDEQLDDLKHGSEWCQLHIRDHSGNAIQNCQPSSPLSNADRELLTHFMNSF